MCDCPSNIFNENEGESILYDCDNNGAGIGIYSGTNSTPGLDTFEFKSLVAGSNVNLTSDADTITISSTDTGVSTLNNVGGFAAVGQSISGSTLNLRTLQGGPGITTTQNANDVTIANTGLLTATNIGPGAGIIPIPIVGGNLQVRSFVGTAAVNVSQTANTINISSPVNTLTSLPGGQSLIGTALPTATLRSLIGGVGISLASSTNNITINNTQTPTNTVTNLGAAAEVLIDVLAGSVRARTLISQGYALVNQSGDNITIGARGPLNIGSGEFIYAGNVGFDNQYKSLLANGNIQVTSDAANIYFRPYINNLVNYSGTVDMNTRVNGNPEYGSYFGFGRAINCNLQDTIPAEIGALDGEFIGWILPYTGTFKYMSVYMQSLTNVTITERVDVYASLHRTKGDPNTLNIWQGLIQTYDSNISIGDYVQRTLDINVDLDREWGCYMVIYCHRPSAGGEVNPLSFSVSCGSIIQSQDAF